MPSQYTTKLHARAEQFEAGDITIGVRSNIMWRIGRGFDQTVLVPSYGGGRGYVQIVI